FYGSYVGVLVPSPQEFGIQRTVEIVTIAYVGGRGTLWGSLLGAIVLVGFRRRLEGSTHGASSSMWGIPNCHHHSPAWRPGRWNLTTLQTPATSNSAFKWSRDRTQAGSGLEGSSDDTYAQFY